MQERSYKLSEIAALVGGDVMGDGNTAIRGVAGIVEAEKGQITFLANSKYERYLPTTRASAVIGPQGLDCTIPSIPLADPYLGYLKVISVFAPNPADLYPRRIHETAVIEDHVTLGKNVSIGPFCHIESGSEIGDNMTILTGACIGKNVTFGDDCFLYANVTIREASQIGDRVIIHPGVVIGADGFGFAKEGGQHRKIPHIGYVRLGNDVEIGANAAIDRGTTGVTRIGAGTKIDNLVQVAHNVIVGTNCIIAGQSGIGGSSELGDNAVVAGQAGVVGHIQIGKGSVIAAKSIVTKTMPDNMTISGWPGRDHNQSRKIYGFTTRLPDLFKRIQELEKKIEQMETGKTNGSTTKNDR